MFAIFVTGERIGLLRQLDALCRPGVAPMRFEIFIASINGPSRTESIFGTFRPFSRTVGSYLAGIYYLRIEIKAQTVL